MAYNKIWSIDPSNKQANFQTWDFADNYIKSIYYYILILSMLQEIENVEFSLSKIQICVYLQIELLLKLSEYSIVLFIWLVTLQH